MTTRVWPLSTQLIVLSVMVFGLLTTSCTKLSRGLASSSGGSSDPIGDYSSGNFVLSTVLASQQNAGSQFDMIGQGSQFDSYCPDTASCVCEFSFVTGGSTQSAEIAPTYTESNLLRCTSQVPLGINEFDVRIATIDKTNYSNAIHVSLSGGNFAGSTLYLDLTNLDSFVQAKRFQCRRHEFIENPLDTLMIDPFQSEDPRVIYPFNFYTTNESESALQMQRLGNQQWECTVTSSSIDLSTGLRAMHWWANANIYSSSTCTEAFCSGDGELMAPQASLASGRIPVSSGSTETGKRRASFWLAKQAYGVFQTPVRAAIAPSGYVASTYGVIGYAAKPIASASGSSSCPSIPLPAKAGWVKLWNYRATDITPAKKVTASQASTISAIACAPAVISRVPTCAKPVTPGGGDYFGLGINNATSLIPASRVAIIDPSVGSNVNACYNLDTFSWDDGTDTGADGIAGTIDDHPWFAKGPEKWNPSPIGFGDPAPAASGTPAGLPIAQVKGLPWGLYSPVTNACKGSDSTASEEIWRYNTTGCPANTSAMDAPAPAGTPADNVLTTVPLSNDNYTDQIFVVTDANVDDSAMRNQSSSIAHYRPVTYRSSGDCNGVSRSSCPPGKEIHWDVNVKEVGNPASADLYPLCVLQFYD